MKKHARHSQSIEENIIIYPCPISHHYDNKTRSWYEVDETIPPVIRDGMLAWTFHPLPSITNDDRKHCVGAIIDGVRFI
jgi:hypothetical protein